MRIFERPFCPGSMQIKLSKPILFFLQALVQLYGCPVVLYNALNSIYPLVPLAALFLERSWARMQP